MIVRFLVVLLLLAVSGYVEAASRFATNNGLTSGTCSTSGTACRMDYIVTVANCGDTINLVSGTYQGANNMLDFVSLVPTNKVCSAGSPMTVTAVTDGDVFIDGQMTRPPFRTGGMSYWYFSGFDAGNAGRNASGDGFANRNGVYRNDVASDHLRLQRICLSNAQFRLPMCDSSGCLNEHIMAPNFTSNSLFEDLCVFGTGRTVITEFEVGAGNVYRRLWLRYEGFPPTEHVTPSDGTLCAPTPVLQTGYDSNGATSIWENIIMVHDPEQYNLSTFGSWTCGDVSYSAAHYQRDPNPSGTNKYRGLISYGYNGFTSVNQVAPRTSDAWVYANQTTETYVDFFLDARSLANGYPFSFYCPGCSGNSADRVTAIKGTGGGVNSSQFLQFGSAAPTNSNECTSLSGCPNFYTGDSPGTGARNCFQYSGGTLTSTPLWPWPMDDRVKAALARANAAGTGGTALSGTKGSGYAANTVTSEIVSRYGSVPTACLTASSFTPSFPVASDFPAVAVLDSFTRADSGTLGANWTNLNIGGTFSIVSNQAVAPAGFDRAFYSGSQITANHEVYATWSTIPSFNDTALSFAATDLSGNNQYRLKINRSATPSNTTVSLFKVDGSGTETSILGPVDLGIDAVNTNGFGVRVSGTTISAYWKWTDGIWYRIGQVTDSTLPTGNVYGGIAGETPAVLDDFGAGPMPSQPPISPPNPPVTGSGVGRFGTTFPGVR